MVDHKDCDLCRHHRRVQLGPNFWQHDCALKQAEYPRAAECGQYAPPAFSMSGRECSGLGYVWDAEPDDEGAL